MSEEALFSIETKNGEVIELYPPPHGFVLSLEDKGSISEALLTLPELKALHEKLGEVLEHVRIREKSHETSDEMLEAIEFINNLDGIDDKYEAGDYFALDVVNAAFRTAALESALGHYADEESWYCDECVFERNHDCEANKYNRTDEAKGWDVARAALRVGKK